MHPVVVAPSPAQAMVRRGFPELSLLPVVLVTLLVAAPWVALASTGPTTPTFVLSWGNSGTGPSQFSTPITLATDALGSVYVTDQSNHRIQKFDRYGNYLLEWGSLGTGSGQFYYPLGVSVDPTGNVYVVDSGNHRVETFNSSGAYLGQWGTLGSGDGQFNGPYGMDVDAAGNVYVTDAFNQRVQKFTTAGTFVTKWGSSGSGDGQFAYPFDVAVDPSGNVYIADAFNHRIQKFTSAGTYLTQWGTYGIGSGQFIYPLGVSVDAVGNVYVADQDNNRIQKFTSTGVYLTQWGSGNGPFNHPSGVAVDAAANVYVADQSNNRVHKFSGAGAGIAEPADALLMTWGASGSGNGQFNRPSSAAVDPAGNVYVADELNHRIQKFTSTGTYLMSWGAFGGGDGQLVGPLGVAIDASGNVYVADTGNNRVQKFTSTGAFLTKWGGFSYPISVAVHPAGTIYVGDLNHHIQIFTSTGALVGQWGSLGSGNGQFSSPYGIAFDAAGNVYVADRHNDRVQKFTSSGVYLTQWGTYGSGDGQFDHPFGVVVDPSGNVLVSELANGRIQKFSSSGTYMAQFGSFGTGTGQFWYAVGIARDASGNVYTADRDNHRVHKWAAPPSIAQVLDVRNDQGRQAQIRFLRSTADAPGSGVTITGYEIYRRNDPLPGPATPPPAASPAQAQLSGWTYLMTAPAHGESEYNVVVPTLVDATASLLEYTAFMVRATTYDPFVFYDSGVENGFSVDNLSPGAPTPFTAAYASGATNLHWGVSAAGDFASFRLYRGSSASFSPGSGNLVIATTDTGYVDVGAAGGWYKLSAVDFNGNESPFALVGPSQTIDVTGLPSPELALEGVRPNPSRGGRMVVHFALPGVVPATLELFDLGGRRVAAREVGSFGAGRHALELAPQRGLKAGVYLIRLSQGTQRHTTRAAVLD